MAEKCSKKEWAKLAQQELEHVWATINAFAPGCWDSLDDLERLIGLRTGESDIDVNKRLCAANMSFLRNRGRQERSKRQKAQTQLAAKDARIAELEGLIANAPGFWCATCQEYRDLLAPPFAPAKVPCWKCSGPLAWRTREIPAEAAQSTAEEPK